MRTCEGLSLTEVLVSLVLVTSASLALIQQQCHVSQFIHQITVRNDAILQLDNASEQLLAQRYAKVDESFQFNHKQINQQTQLELSWENDTPRAGGGYLRRRLVDV